MKIIIIGGAGLLILLLIVGIIWIVRRRKRFPHISGDEFEYYCAGLLEKQGFEEIEVTKSSGDYGADILAERDGITYAFQCKYYADHVGVRAVQEIYAGRDFYDRMVGIVMTNQYYTAPARKAAEKLKIILWDGDDLTEMEEL